MTASKIFLPPKIHVGYKERKDTFTQKLAYVIYYDEKGTLRKETSFRSWLAHEHDGKFLGEEDFLNAPTSGFVLNKKVGDYKSNWNFRSAHARVYDPRGFEFEISIENLLWILENTNSIKGKGLEGDFVYGWDGADLILVPTSSPDYVEIKSFTDAKINREKITSKSLVLGGTYLANDNQELIYLGKFDCYNWSGKLTGKAFFFVNKDGGFITSKSLSKVLKTISTEPVYNYADLIDKLEVQNIYSPVDKNHVEYIPYTWEQFLSMVGDRTYAWNISCMRNGRYTDCVRINSEDTCRILLRDTSNIRAVYEDYRFSYVERERDSFPNFNSLKEFFDTTIPAKKQLFLTNGKPYN